VGYGATTVLSNYIYVYLYDIWGNTVKDATVRCGTLTATFNSTSMLYSCGPVSGQTTVYVSHPKYLSVQFTAQPGNIYKIQLFPVDNVPNEPPTAPATSTQDVANLVLENPSSQYITATVQFPSGCVFNIQTGAAQNTVTVSPQSAKMVTVSGPYAGCDNGEVAVYVDNKKVWGMQWGSLKGTTQYVLLTTEVKLPVTQYNPFGNRTTLLNATNLSGFLGALSGNWWILVAAALGLIILILLVAALSRR
jgi:hypothetical protein